jgi:fatty acid desaturase
MSMLRRRSGRRRVGWPTLLVALIVYSGFALVTWYHDVLPWPMVLAVAAWLAAWQGSLQHEVTHGHPTPWRVVNHALAMPGFLLWVPFGIYRKTHLRHHVDSRLTDPLEDPESFYVTPQEWARLGPMRRRILWLHNTLAGRLLLGPARAIGRLYSDEARRLASGDSSHLRDWAWHVPGLALVLGWAIGVCGMPLWQYLLGFVYGGTALTLLRSFLEHRAVESVGKRTAIVEAGPLLSLLFLNNNLHAVHHAYPRRPWFELRALYRAEQDKTLAGNGGYRYAGYREIFANYFLKAKEPPVHPLSGGPRLEAGGRRNLAWNDGHAEQPGTVV